MTVAVIILRIDKVVLKLGVARSTIYDWINEKSPRNDPTFPKRVRLGKSAVGWIESELDEWLLSKKIAA